MGFGLYFLEVLDGEIGCGENIVGTQLVDGPVEAFGFSLREVATIDCVAKGITFLLKGFELLQLIGWGFVSS